MLNNSGTTVTWYVTVWDGPDLRATFSVEVIGKALSKLCMWNGKYWRWITSYPDKVMDIKLLLNNLRLTPTRCFSWDVRDVYFLRKNQTKEPFFNFHNLFIQITAQLKIIFTESFTERTLHEKVLGVALLCTNRNGSIQTKQVVFVCMCKF